MDITTRGTQIVPRSAIARALIAVALVLSVLTQVAISHASAPSAVHQKRLTGTLTLFASSYTPAKPTKTNPHPATYLATIVRNYEQLHPGVTIKLLPNVTQSSVAFRQWKDTQFAGGTEPDIIYNNPVDANNIDVPKGWFIPLDKYLNAPDHYVSGNKAWADLFGTGVLANVRNANGRLYNLAMDGIDTAIFYNKTAFKKAGIGRPPKTFAEWMQDMARLKKAGYIPYYLNAGAAGQDYVDWHERQLADMLYYSESSKLHALPGGSKGTFQLTSTQVARAIKSGLFRATDPRYLEVLKLLRQFASYAQPGFEGVSATGTPYSLFSSGKLAMYEGASPDVQGLAQLHLHFPYGTFMAIPRLTKQTSKYAAGVVPGKIGIVGAFANYNVTVATTKRDHNLPLAIDFLQYLSQPDTGGRMITQLGILVPLLKHVPIPKSLKVFVPSLVRRDALFPGFVARLDPQFANAYYKVLQVYLLGQMDESTAASQIQLLMEAAANRVPHSSS